MLDKMSRRSIQVIKKDDNPEFIASAPEPDQRKKTIAKSRFAKAVDTHQIDMAKEEDTQPLINNNSSKVLMTVSTIDFLNADEMTNSIEFKRKEDEFKKVLDKIVQEEQKSIKEEPKDGPKWKEEEKQPNNVLAEENKETEEKKEKLFIEIPKVDLSAFKFTTEETNNDNPRTRSRSGGNFDNRKKANLAGKLADIQLKKTIKELKHPNLEEIRNEEEYLSSPRLNMGSPTIKKCKEVNSNQQQLKSQVKFLNSAVLTFSLMIEFVQKLTDETKLPYNMDFWYNEQKSNLEFLIGKLAESELSEEYMQRGDNIKKFNEKLLEAAKVLFIFFGGGGG